MMLIFTGIYLFGKDSDNLESNDKPKEDKQSPDATYSECDLKAIQKFYYCGEENKLLRGLICPICIEGKCEWQNKTCTKSGIFPHLDEKWWEKQQEAERRKLEEEKRKQHQDK